MALSMKLAVDLNADLGEGAGHDEALLGLVTSANIACGFHAGDAATMRTSIEAALARNVAVGAHPSLFDRENFGRKELPVKPNEALYNMAARDDEIADAIARAVVSVDKRLIFFAPVRSSLSRAGETRGLQIVHEVFADRNYCGDGSLVSRSRPDALLHDATQAAPRVLRM